MRKYRYAVMDRNLIGTDGTARPVSVHNVRDRALDAARQYDRRPGYSDMIVVAWGSGASARENPDACELVEEER